MSKFHSHITSAGRIIGTYVAGKPLAIHIKSFFAADKKFGSKDRRSIASLCYYYYRTGRLFCNAPAEEKILLGLFLCEQDSSEMLDFFRPDLNKNIAIPLDEKFSLLNIKPHDIFPFLNDLGKETDPVLFTLSFLKQPAVYLRVRPGKNKAVLEKLEAASIKYTTPANDAICLQANVAVDKILKLNREVVVQDLNSQKVLNYLDQENSYSTAMQNSAWDCCAASGGKSILLYDKLSGKVRLTVSDIRENILANLRKRFQEAGISINRDFITDLARASGLPANENFSIIICDAPCTGSGTWARNPEQLFYFNAATIDSYAERQRKIVSNTIPHLKVGGLFFYITCSVFKKENEEIVDFILNSVSPAQPGCHLVLKHVAYLKGYEIAADNMFVAVFSKTNL